MPDVTPPEIAELRKTNRRVHKDQPRVEPPTCDICRNAVDPVTEEYVIDVDGTWGHLTCLDDHLQKEEGKHGDTETAG